MGSHQPAEGTVETVDHFPDPQEFYEKYVKASKPLLIKAGADRHPAYTLWNDEYLA